MPKPGVMFYFDIRPCIKRLTTEEKGQLFEAILDYGEFGSFPNFDDRLGIAWDFIQPKLDRDTELYGHKVAQRQYAVYVREARKRDHAKIPFDEWVDLSDNEKNRLLSADIGSYPTSTPTPTPTSTSASTSTDNIGADSRPTTTQQRFKPPSADDVRAYATEKGYTIDPEAFVDYYTANGWRLGKNSMKDWKAAVRIWTRKDNKHGNYADNKRDPGQPEKPPIKIRSCYEL